MSTENTDIAVKKPDDIANGQLLTIEPKDYVAAVYEPFKNRLAEAVQATLKVNYTDKEAEGFIDVTTTAGFEAAKKNRALFRDIRTSGENERKARKAPITEIGRLLDSAYLEIKEQIEPLESIHDAAVKAEEQRKEEIKAEKIRQESLIEERIKAITTAPIRAIALSSDGVQSLIDELSIIVPDVEQYGERTVEAELALESTIASLKSLHEGKVAIEQQAAQQAERDAQAQRERDAQARTELFKSRIQSIKNNVLLGAECETSEQINLIINTVSNVNIDDYAEFKEEAQAAKDAALKSLERQLKLIVIEESEKAAPVQETPLAPSPSSSGVYQPALGIGEVLTEVAPAAIQTAFAPETATAPLFNRPIAAESVSRPQDSAGEPAKPTLSVTETIYFKGQQPTPEELVTAVAISFKVEETRALLWLKGADFNGLKLAA